MESEQQPAHSSPLAEQLWRRHVLTAGVIPKQHSLAVTHDHWPSPGERLPLLGEVHRRWRVAAGAVLPAESLVVPLTSNPQGHEPEMTAGPPRSFAVPRHEVIRASHANDVSRTAPLPRLEETHREPVSPFPARPNSETTPSPVSVVSTAMPSRTEATPGSPPTPTAAPTVVVGAGIRQRALTTRPESVIQRKVAAPATDTPRTAAPLHSIPSPLPLPSHTRGAAFSRAPAVPVEQAVHSSPRPLPPPPPSPQREHTTGGPTASVSSRREHPVEQVMPLGPSLSRPTTIPRRPYTPDTVVVGGARSFRRVMRDEPLPLSTVHARAPHTIGDAPALHLRAPGTELPGYPQTPRWGVSISPSGAVEGSRGFQPPVRGARNDSGFHLMPLPVARTTVRHETTAAVPTPRTPVPVAARSPVEAVALPTLTTSSPDPQVDVGQLAEHVYTILVQRLTREKHRRGW